MEETIETKPGEAPTPKVSTQDVQTPETPAQDVQTPKTAAQDTGGGGTPPPPTPQKPPAQKPSRPKKKLIILGLVLLLLAGLVSAFIAVAYFGVELPFISKDLSYQLQKTYADLPLVPKAPRHILLQSLESSLEIKTFTFDASLSMEDFDIALSGDVEVKTDTVNFDIDVAAKSSTPTAPFTLKGDLITLNDILYFNVGTLSSPLISSLGVDLTPAIGEWWKYDLAPLGTQAREALKEEQEGEAKTITQRAQQKALEVFSHPEISKAVVKRADEKIGEEMSYHLFMAPTKEAFIKLMEVMWERSLSNEEKENVGKSFDEIEKLEVDLWIGKETSVVRKIKFLFKVKAAVQEGGSPYGMSIDLLGLETFEGAFVLELPKINAPVSITAPEGARDVEELIQLLLEPPQPLQEALGEQIELLLEGRR